MKRITTSRVVLPLVLMGFCLLGLVLCPSLHLNTLFLKQDLPVETLFAYPPESHPLIEGTRFRVSHVTSNPAGSHAVESEHLYFGESSAGILEILIPPDESYQTSLFIDAYGLDGSSVLMSIQSSQSPIPLRRWQYQRNQFILLSPHLNAHEPTAVRIESIPPQGKLVVERLKIRRVRKEHALPALHTLIIFLLVVWVFVSVLMERNYPWGTVLMAGFAALGIMLFGIRTGVSALLSPWYWLALLCVLIFERAYRGLQSLGGSVWHPYNFLIVFSLALALRWDHLVPVLPHPLLGNPFEYHQFVLNLNWAHPLSNGFREPLYIWIQWLGSQLLGPNDYQFRIVTVFLSLLMVIGTYLFGSRISGRQSVGLAAAFLMSWSHFAVYSSVWGERNELFNLLVLLYGLLCTINTKSFWYEVGLGLLGALITLTWLFGILGVIFVYGVRMVVMRIRPRWALCFALTIVLGVSAHLLNQWRLFGDPFHVINLNAGYYRQAEATHEYSLKYANQGNWFQYLVRERGVLTVLQRTAWGYLSIFLNPKNFYNHLFLGFHYTQNLSYAMFPLFVWGLICEGLKKRWWVGMIILGFLNAAPYLQQELVQPRYLFLAAPYVAYYWAVGLVSVMAGGMRLLRLKLRFPVQITD